MRMLLTCATLALLATPHLLVDGFMAASMPQLGLADTEAVAYAPFAVTNGCSEKIYLRMDSAPAAANNAEVVFGIDADGDGVLSPDEERLLVGWDCGSWKFVDCQRQKEVSSPGVASGPRAYLRIMPAAYRRSR